MEQRVQRGCNFLLSLCCQLETIVSMATTILCFLFFKQRARGVFKRGALWRGIYLPTLTSSFCSQPLELAYQRYSHRQRQKALMIVNCVDLAVKLALLLAALLSGHEGRIPVSLPTI
jgi:hypothetical protein